MMRRLPRLGLGLATLLGLGACAQGVTIAPTYMYDNYTLTVLNQAAREGGMWVNINGTPFPNADQSKVVEAIEFALTNQRFGVRFPVVAEPRPEFSRIYRVEWVWSPAINADIEEVCVDPNVPRDPDRPGLRVLAAFCVGKRAYVTMIATGEEATGPDDPRFRTLLRQVAVNLFPPIFDRAGTDDDNFRP